MKRTVLNRYERAVNGGVIIDVAAQRVEDLYNHFDRSAPFIRRDLDSDLVDYLIACVRELDRAPFIIRFTLAESPDEPRLSRVSRSVNSYFLYLAQIERQKIVQIFRRSGIFLCLGVTILIVSVLLDRVAGMEDSVVGNVVTGGLTVAVWVALWEALANLLFEWLPHHKNIRIYRRLAHAELIFRAEPPLVSDTNGDTGRLVSISP